MELVHRVKVSVFLEKHRVQVSLLGGVSRPGYSKRKEFTLVTPRVNSFRFARVNSFRFATPTKYIKRELLDQGALCTTPYEVDRNNRGWIGLEFWQGMQSLMVSAGNGCLKGLKHNLCIEVARSLDFQVLCVEVGDIYEISGG